MDLMTNICRQHDLYLKGMLTYGEMLNNIIELAEAEKSYVIEYKAKGKVWRRFTDTLYSLTEAKAEIERISVNDMGIIFRYKAAY